MLFRQRCWVNVALRLVWPAALSKGSLSGSALLPLSANPGRGNDDSKLVLDSKPPALLEAWYGEADPQPQALPVPLAGGA